MFTVDHTGYLRFYRGLYLRCYLRLWFWRRLWRGKDHVCRRCGFRMEFENGDVTDPDLLSVTDLFHDLPGDEKIHQGRPVRQEVQEARDGQRDKVPVRDDEGDGGFPGIRQDDAAQVEAATGPRVSVQGEVAGVENRGKEEIGKILDRKSQRITGQGCEEQVPLPGVEHTVELQKTNSERDTKNSEAEEDVIARVEGAHERVPLNFAPRRAWDPKQGSDPDHGLKPTVPDGPANGEGDHAERF